MLADADNVPTTNREAMRMRCRERAEAMFRLETHYERYLNFYRSLLADAA